MDRCSYSDISLNRTLLCNRERLLWDHFEEDDKRSRIGKQLCVKDGGPANVGGILLLWIGVKLLTEEDDDHEVDASENQDSLLEEDFLAEQQVRSA